MAAHINKQLQILREANDSLNKHKKLHEGLCWCQEMEKESELQLNPYTIINLRQPELRQRIKEMKEYLKEFVSLKPNEQQELSFEVFKNKTEWHGQLKNYNLKEEVKDAVFMINEVEVKQRGKKYNNKELLRQVVNNLAHRYVLATTRILDIPCTCKGSDELSLAQILPVGANTPEIICYNSCNRTLFAAYKRQMMRVFKPDQKIADEFIKFTRNYFHTYVEPVLETFDYSLSQWLNKMPRHKQEAMDQAKRDIEKNGYPEEVNYGLFCKREKQEAGGKNRAIANIDPVIKYIMGPVCWALEDRADKFFPGYCGKKNWNDLENLFEAQNNAGFKYVLQGDGSAFDTCQHYELKEIDRLIYSYLADHGKIWHVEPSVFKQLACAEFRNLNAKMSINKRYTTMANATIRGTVFSGASDTTLMNTLRMALYNQFTLEREGLVYDRDFKHYAKGDDFMVFVKELQWKGQDFDKIYYKTWKPKPKHSSTDFYDNKGCLGMILKFLNVGGFDTIDFCSTTCIPYAGGLKFKLARKPNRMDPLGHYSMKAKKMTNGQLKQYYKDQGFALLTSVGNMPFYRSYAVAYYKKASQIKAKASRLMTGRIKKEYEDDGHEKVQLTHMDEIAELFNDYGHDYKYGLVNRESHHHINDNDAYYHLLKHFGISEIDCQYHENFLINGGIYDTIAK